MEAGLKRTQRLLNLGSVSAILVIGVFGILLGTTYPLLTLVMEDSGLSSSIIGLSGAMTPLGMVLTAPFLPFLTSRLSPWSLMLSAALGAAAITLMLATTRDFGVWFALRFALGSCAVIMFILSETWINYLSTGRNRGRLLTLYASALALGFAVGPSVLALSNNQVGITFIVSVMAPLAAIGPLVTARTSVPPMSVKSRVPVIRLVKGLSYLLVAVLAVSVFDSATLQFLPSYGSRLGMSPNLAALTLTALLLGQFLFQYPFGWLADLIGAQRTLLLTLALSAAGALLLPWAFLSGSWVWPYVAVWGGVSFAGYPLALASLGEMYSREDFLVGNAAFAILWGLGGIAGPPYVGIALDAWGTDGYSLSLFSLSATAVVLVGTTSMLSHYRRGRAGARVENAT